VDLVGQLSNPALPLKTVARQGSTPAGEGATGLSLAASRSPTAADSGGRTNPGQHSNPDRRAIQRRLHATEIEDLVAGYRAGRSLADLAAALGVHRRTVAAHLEQRGVQRRVNVRKLRDADIGEASRRYRAGDSLATVGKAHGVHPTTVRRELMRAGVIIRPRRGL
jgi:hypothetical protein